MDELINVLKMGNKNDVHQALTSYLAKNSQLFTITEAFDKKKKLVELLFRILRDNEYKSHHFASLAVLRIISRDKQNPDLIFTADRIETLLHLARLVGEEEAFMTSSDESFDPKIVVEAQKCLCNLIYNSTTILRLCASNSCVEGIMLRLRMYKDPNLPHEVKYFDMRMLFFLTALCGDIRPSIRNEFHGCIYLMEAIDLILKNATEVIDEKTPTKGKRKSKKGSRKGRLRLFGDEPNNQILKDDEFNYCLSDNDVELACEVLKVLFNLTCSLDRNNMDESEEAHCLRLVSILHDLLLSETRNKDKKDLLQTHTINLLTAMPPSSFEELLTPLNEVTKGDNEFEYEDYNVEAIAVLLEYLDRKLQSATKNRETMSPILVTLIAGARSNRIIRKYLRARILPPLRDVKRRPEHGATIRNRLVRLMTDPNTDLKEMVAELLFILCKESVGRLIKYTGYGNAAGLLANRGLMLGGRGQTAYSSESEESDTEEYIANKDKINPVIGCVEDPKPNPLEGMSEEQKEYEAMQLVNMMDKLQREGLVQPCKIGEDGRPHPVEHVLELQNKQKIALSDSDSDSE